MTELALSPAEMLAEHTGNVAFLPTTDDVNRRVRTALLERAERRVDQLVPPGFTRQQRDHLVSFAEEAAVRDLSTLDMAILNGIASMTLPHPRVGFGMGPS